MTRPSIERRQALDLRIGTPARKRHIDVMQRHLPALSMTRLASVGKIKAPYSGQADSKPFVGHDESLEELYMQVEKRFRTEETL